MSDSIPFDRAAEFYDQTRAFPPGTEPQVVKMIRTEGQLDAGSRVLEIGVGTGRVALPLARDLYGAGGSGYYVGIDLAVPMMERLRAKKTSERIVIAQADALELPFADATFDAVIAVHVFHLIPRWQEVLKEVARVLKPGARLVNMWSENFHNDAWWSTWDQHVPRDVRFRSNFDFRDVRQFSQRTGWLTVGEGQNLVTHSEVTPRQFLEQIEKRIWSSTWNMSDDQLAAGAAAVRAVMDAAGQDQDTPIAHESLMAAQAFFPPQ